MLSRTLIITAVVAVLALAGCSGGGSLPSPTRFFYGVGDAVITPDAAQADGLLGSVQLAMAGRQFNFGLYSIAATGQQQLTLADGQSVGSKLFGIENTSTPFDFSDGWLTLNNTSANSREPLDTIPPDMSQLELRGSFDSAALNALVATQQLMLFDPLRTMNAATSTASVPVHWELSGLMNGLPFDYHFTQAMHVWALDANN